MGYPKDLLSSRAVIKHGSFAIIPPEGLVNNVIPNFEKCTISIVASPKLGASFVQYLVDMESEGKTTNGFGGNGIESFIFVREGEIKVAIDNDEYELTSGGYVYCPPTKKMNLSNTSKKSAKFLLYKQTYQPLEDHKPWVVVGNINELQEKIYDDMENVTIIDLLPCDLAFDMNMHILTFKPSGCHPFVETHVQEHGAYIMKGEGVYYLDDKWTPVKKGDYIWFGPYVPQAVYCVGREELSYIYSKDCNRDVEL